MRAGPPASDSACREVHDRPPAPPTPPPPPSLLFSADPLHKVRRGPCRSLAAAEELLGTADLIAEAISSVTVRMLLDGLDHVPVPGFAPRAHHGRALSNTPERLAQSAATAHEGNGEVPLVDVVLLVGGVRTSDSSIVSQRPATGRT